MPMADLTSADCWAAIQSLATEDGEADKIQPHVIGKLIETGFVALGPTGLPELTDKGRHAHPVAESGEGHVYELDWLPPKM